MKRAVRSIIHLIAAGFAAIGLSEICLEIVHHLGQVHKHIEPVKTNIWHYIIGAVLLVIGATLFLGSESLAEQLTDEPDDNDDGDNSDQSGDTHE
jgi:hypothetical protein